MLPAAHAEAEAARDWYAKHSEAAARAFIDDLKYARALIAEAPERWPAYLHGTRRVLLARFPYSIVYRATPARVTIVALVHQRQLPGYWRGRR